MTSRNLYRAPMLYTIWKNLLSQEGYSAIVINAGTKEIRYSHSLSQQHQFDALIFVGSSMGTQRVKEVYIFCLFQQASFNV